MSNQAGSGASQPNQTQATSAASAQKENNKAALAAISAEYKKGHDEHAVDAKNFGAQQPSHMNQGKLRFSSNIKADSDSFRRPKVTCRNEIASNQRDT